jgi:hypothetical protein
LKRFSQFRLIFLQKNGLKKFVRYLKKTAWSASFRLEKFEEKLEIVIKLFEAKN